MSAQTVITHAPSQGVTLRKASDSAYTPWERDLMHRRDSGLSLDMDGLPGHREGLAMNDPVTLASVFAIITG